MNISGVGAGSQQLYELQPARRSQPSFSDTAQLLGMSSQQLQNDLQSGTTLSSLAEQKGVSSSDLLASVEQDLQVNAPQGAPGLSSTQAQQMATNLINGTPPQPPTGGAGAYGRDGQGGFRLQPSVVLGHSAAAGDLEPAAAERSAVGHDPQLAR